MKELSKEEDKMKEWSKNEDKEQINDMVKDLASEVEDHGGEYKEVQKGKGVMPYKRGYFVRDRSLKNSREDVFYISNRGVDILSKYLEKDEIKNQVKEAIEKKFGEGSYDKLPKNMIKDIRKEYKEALEDAKESKIKKILKAQKEDIKGILALQAQKEAFKALSENNIQEDEASLDEEASKYEENSEVSEESPVFLATEEALKETADGYDCDGQDYDGPGYEDMPDF